MSTKVDLASDRVMVEGAASHGDSLLCLRKGLCNPPVLSLSKSTLKMEANDYLVSFPYPLAADSWHPQACQLGEPDNDYLNIIWINIELSDHFRTQGLESGLVEPPEKTKSGFVSEGGLIEVRLSWLQYTAKTYFYKWCWLFMCDCRIEVSIFEWKRKEKHKEAVGRRRE